MSKNDIVTKELLLTMFLYETGTGELRWRKDGKRGTRAGCIAGSDNNGYLQVNIQGSCFKIHHLVWFLEYGEFPTGHVDHIDGNRRNNSRSNLREVTQQENSHNQRFAKGYYKTKTGKFRAQIKLNGKVINLGSYDTETEARFVYLEAKKVYHPSFIHTLKESGAKQPQ